MRESHPYLNVSGLTNDADVTILSGQLCAIAVKASSMHLISILLPKMCSLFL
jgi:hypothetical protein